MCIERRGRSIFYECMSAILTVFGSRGEEREERGVVDIFCTFYLEMAHTAISLIN